jgi:DNA-directed RNA polymerase I subunit RPA2
MVTATVNSNTSFDTLRREDLFRNPPKDKSAFPALIASVRPHIDSFDALTEEGGLFDLARKDISVKTILGGKDGNNGNKISCGYFRSAHTLLFSDFPLSHTAHNR